MNISAPFVRRPIATSLLAAAVILAGLVAYRELPVAPLPRVDFPTIQVSGKLPGASPDTMASSVATPLERRFGRIAGLTEMTSVNTLGSTSITLQFDLDRDVTGAARDVQAAINASLAELPPNLPSLPNYRKVNPADSPILILSLTSKTLPLAQVFDAANSVLAQKMSQIPGVGQVFVGGGQQPAVRVQVDQEALAGHGLSMEDVRNALAASTSNQPKGRLTGSNLTYNIAATDQLLTAADYQPLVVSYQNGATIRLGDVAKVFDDVEDDRLAGWIDGQRCVLMIIRRQPGANILETIEGVKKALPFLKTSISPAIDVNIAVDRTTTIRASVRDVERTLILSVFLVTAVVFVFLRSARATAIPSIAVPLSLVGTFGIMYLLGYSIDNLSLMALTISTGFVVDDAIVVTENIARFIEEGKTPLEAAFEGAKQIGFTILSITISLIAVFIPILLMGGIIGRLFREFAVTLSIAVALSGLVSLTVTPTMAGRLLRPVNEEHLGRFGRASERTFAWLVRGYDRGLRFVLRHSFVMLLLTIGTLGLTVLLAIRVPKGLFPQQDTGMLAGFSEAAQDISSKAMRHAQEKVNQIVQQDPDVEHVIAFVGGSSGAGNTGTVFISLKDYSKRKSTADQVIGRLRPKLGKVPGITLFLQSVQDVRMGGRSSRTQYQYALEDADLAELQAWSPKVLAKLKTLPMLRDVATDQQTAGLMLGVNVDRDSASRLGIDMQAVDNTLYDAFGQRQVATSFTPLNYYRVVLEATPEQQASPDQLVHVYVRGANGALVPLPSIATVAATPTPLAVTHQGQFPATTLSFNLAAGAALGDAVKAVDAATRQIGLPSGVHASFQGTAQAFGSSLSSEPWLIAAALFVVYIVLGMLYESLIHPITILSTLPSAALGALVALFVFRTDFSIIALIGVVLLLGIVKKNAIMMIDFALEAERRERLEPAEAIRRACLLRFRPILMTTLAALFGAVPLAIGFGAGSELRQPLGITIVGGLCVSQLMNLFSTPVIYLYLDRLRRDRAVEHQTAVAEA
ncbi:MAG TPA: multidrug efflux RND transporter permease subunit [Polyangia bacterium]|jgi:hydrophobe/amphiphile efflux-1 (HAE1) family protein|nr:multidrug efflux RND transporter permease subunit [Polyangia bacterium]